MAFDIFILIVLLFTTIRGAAKGVAWQLAGIGALVLCFLFATPLSLTIAPMIKLAPPLNRWVAMLGIYLVFSFGTFAVARGFREALEKAKFVEFDRHIGALFGLAKGAIVALVITFFSVAMSERAREYVLTTYTGYAAAHIMNAIDPVMPRELHAILEPYIHELDAVDPELGRERELRHEQLGEYDQPDPDDMTRPTTGYRPVAGTGSEVGGLDPDPFQNETYQPRPPGYSGPGSIANPGIGQAPATAPSLAEEAQQFIQSLPNLVQQVGPAVQQQLLNAYRNTSAEHRNEFADELRNAPSPERITSIARSWQRGRPRRTPVAAPIVDEDQAAYGQPGQVSSDRPVPRIPGRATAPNLQPNLAPIESNVDLQPRRQDLLQGIAQIFSSQPALQAKKMSEIDTYMLGLPDQVAVGVLEDWLSDLRGEDPDPDPQTSVATQFNIRISRQLELQQIPPNRLPPEWQTRLEGNPRN